MKKRDRLMHQLMIRYINTTDEYIKELENQIDRLEKQNKFLMERENKDRKTHEHGEWYDFVAKDGIGVRFGRYLDGRCTVIHKVHGLNK